VSAGRGVSPGRGSASVICGVGAGRMRSRFLSVARPGKPASGLAGASCGIGPPGPEPVRAGAGSADGRAGAAGAVSGRSGPSARVGDAGCVGGMGGPGACARSPLRAGARAGAGRVLEPARGATSAWIGCVPASSRANSPATSLAPSPWVGRARLVPGGRTGAKSGAAVMASPDEQVACQPVVTRKGNTVCAVCRGVTRRCSANPAVAANLVGVSAGGRKTAAI
jgi:hypothetical protein